MYIYSYSDKIFLKVVCAKNAFKEKQSIPFVSSAEIERYLTKYNSNYKFLNKIFVYLNKFEYLVRLIWYKIEDLLEVFTKH